MGGAEPTLYRGSVWYTPIVEEWYYQVEVLKLEVGDQNLDLDCREVNFKLCYASLIISTTHHHVEMSIMFLCQG